ncbi:polymer-forming cytoskeletal protein [Rhodospirillum sp. A1_3_36]|uniref:polymer-forming cytoskeletal protein n=1 Tax=Rhodospirillum sp. A1_3_36 TaxID=3391666 RepID=UPI0039A5F2D6
MNHATPGLQTYSQKPDTQEAGPSFIAPDLVIRGRLSSGAEVFVAGRVEGEVDCKSLSITKGGAIDGSVTVCRLNLEAGSSLNGEAHVELMGVKGDASVTARITCRGSNHLDASRGHLDASRARGMVRQSDKGLETLSSLTQPLPAE